MTTLAPLSKAVALRLAAVALAITIINSVKSLQIDDAAYYCYAAQIAQHPLEPYGFVLHWYQHPYPANEILAPPGFLYWWAGAIAILGDDPAIWKLALLPIHLVLVFALNAILRRFAAGWHEALTVLTAFSPAVLPGINLMLDVPAMAAGLAALALFFRATDRQSITGAILAGLVAGLAMQTKYTAFVLPPLMMVYALLFGRLRWGVAAAAVAGFVFVAWEAFVAHQHGQSHFLCALGERQPKSIMRYPLLLVPMTSLLGGLGAPIGLAGLAALGVSSRGLKLCGAIVALDFLMLMLVSASATTFYRDANGHPRLGVSIIVHGGLGIALLGILLATARSVLKAQSPVKKQAWFLVLWLLLEVLCYLGLTPFPAARRVIGILVAATVLVGHLGTLRGHRLPRWVVTFGIVLGLFYAWVDLREAGSVETGVARARPAILGRDPDARIWFVGTWGMKYYAERDGMTMVVTGRSAIRTGDWLIVPRGNYHHPMVNTDRFERIGEIVVGDAMPLRTMPCYYDSGRPLEHHEGPRFVLDLYRATADHTAKEP